MSAITELEQQVLRWPAARRIHLVEKLLASVEDFTDAAVKAAWEREIGRRVSEVREGKVEAVPEEEVFFQARKALSETRRLSSTRRKGTD
jgi:putative addiction module component (TIGR02574 family)